MKRRGRITLLAIIILAVGLLLLPLLLRFTAGLVTEWLWFESLGYLSVFRTRLFAEIGMFVIGGLAALAFLGVNWLLAPRRLLRSPAQVIRVRRISFVMAQPPVLIGLLVVGDLLIALLFALAASGHSNEMLLFTHAASFDLRDPIFGLDAGFYVFRLPFYRFLASWLTTLVVVGLLGATLLYGLRGSLREKIATIHLSVLGALFLMLMALQYQLNRLALLDSARGVVFGAGYTDVHARLPLMQVLSIILLAGAAVLLANIFLRTWRILVAMLALWLLTAVIGPVYPAIVQRFVVMPNELAAERPYIEHNIAFTRHAFNLEHVQAQDFPANGQLSPEVLEANAATIENIRLWDWRPLLATYQQLQVIRLYYTFVDIDVDRYMLDGQLREVMLGARELETSLLASQAQTWVNRHLVFTHGYGVCLNAVNEVTDEGLPRLLVRDIPPQSEPPELAITRPEIYFGEATDNYAIINTSVQEFDRPSGDENVYTRYEGPDGVALSNLWRRMLFAMRLGDQQILFSTAIGPQSRILLHRQLSDRAITLAPFLWYDEDPYLVIADGRLIWLRDAYTWTDRFPYSEPFRGVNYVRNSVKVAIDAYTGETTYYVVDPSDPIIRTYQAIYPDLFAPVEEMPQALRDHWRYPEKLFELQSEAFATYHMTDPQVFYNKEDLWAIPTETYQGTTRAMAPYYVVMRLPQEDELEFLLMRPYVPNGRGNMIAWLYADSDGADYGQLGVFNFPKQELIYGPMQIAARFNQDPLISQQLTLWDQRGSNVILGNLLVIPTDDTLLYIQPLYLQAQEGQLPELRRLLVAYGNRVTMAESLEAALQQVLTGAPPTAGEEPVPTEPTGDVNTLARSAQEHYSAAQECLRQGDWSCYGRELEALGADLAALVEATEP